MTPGAPITVPKLRLFHALFRELGPEAEEAVRDQVEELTGARSTKGLNEGQAWDILDGLLRSLERNNPFPICVTWCPKYTRKPARLQAGSGVVSLPSQAQVWFIHRSLKEYGIPDIQAFLRQRHRIKDGIIRTAQQAWWISKACREMPQRKGFPSPYERKLAGRSKRAHG